MTPSFARFDHVEWKTIGGTTLRGDIVAIDASGVHARSDVGWHWWSHANAHKRLTKVAKVEAVASRVVRHTDGLEPEEDFARHDDVERVHAERDREESRYSLD